MNSTQQLIERFYQAFQQRDWRTMQICYHTEATFHDPAFRTLNYKQTKAMWHMLCENAKEFRLEFSDATANENTGKCKWRASYLFSRSGRQVHNIIDADFQFKDGLIVSHRDSFDLWRWSRMALGTPGILLGWTNMMQQKVHDSAMQSLTKFIENHPEYR